MVTDTIGDFLSRIKNAQERNKQDVIMPSSKMLLAISKILMEEGYIKDFKEEEREKNAVQKDLRVKLRYIGEEKGAIEDLERVSKPGVRIYVGYRNIPRVKNGLGITILSTPKGVLTGESAKKERVGGELLCKVW
jgi:small subunit ribosomal protein S8